MEIYVVKSGDTVYSISRQFGISPERLVSDNSLSPKRELALGQSLLILKPRVVHTFQPGDTLFTIAQRYGTTVNRLYQNNPSLIGYKYIDIGTEIVIEFEDTPSKTIEVSGFTYGYINRGILETSLPYLTYLIPFGYGFTDEGKIITLNDSDMIDLAHSYGTSVLLSLSAINVDGSFGSGKIERLLTDIEFQNKVISGFIEIILQKGAQGLDIDIEYVPPQFREEYAAFAANARSQLEPLGLILHLDLAPKISPDQKGTLYEAHDYGLLGAAADYVFLMTYEWGYTYGHSGYR
ncbi:MAG: LysM peptidoglycan-binding domain-containing protein [Oscillospiraceae bacterium]|nr:LysM peptidoglycan-binding domain-containing protein [Oscillospiraceae bacterium]